ncbi:hypothetical protein TWF730_010223 [Orbilia blumenaviensis]|uniref:RING-type domain-containing protein n=1 Tax=Orbilia blumenaviensis TaxID=1796055 RepID=A0AAV9UR46_9PEZI
MAPLTQPKSLVSDFARFKEENARILQNISQLAVSLAWVKPVRKRESPRKAAARDANKVDVNPWTGRTRATKIVEPPNAEVQVLPKPPKAYPQEVEATCFICDTTTPVYKLTTLSCGHAYCQDCLLLNYETSLRHPASFPPRCCEPLDFADTAYVLSPEQIEEFLKAKARYDSAKIVPCAYCGNDLFDATTLISESAAYCSNCDKLTCSTCRKEMHKDVCPESEGTEELQKMARAFGWSQCPKCSRVISKDIGCNHIFCEESIRHFDGLGCRCIDGVKAKEINFGESFQPVNGIRNILTQQAYNKTLTLYRREAARKSRKFAELREIILASKEKHFKDLKMAEELVSLRAQFQKLGDQMRKKRGLQKCEDYTAEVEEGSIEVKAIAVKGNPGMKPTRSTITRKRAVRRKRSDDTSAASSHTMKRAKSRRSTS